MRLTRHPPSRSGCFYRCGCLVATTTVGKTPQLACQTIPVLSPVLALLSGSVVITITAFLGLEQLFSKMRIAGWLVEESLDNGARVSVILHRREMLWGVAKR
jgi:hypothetical protein